MVKVVHVLWASRPGRGKPYTPLWRCQKTWCPDANRDAGRASTKEQKELREMRETDRGECEGAQTHREAKAASYVGNTCPGDKVRCRVRTYTCTHIDIYTAKTMVYSKATLGDHGKHIIYTHTHAYIHTYIHTYIQSTCFTQNKPAANTFSAKAPG